MPKPEEVASVELYGYGENYMYESDVIEDDYIIYYDHYIWGKGNQMQSRFVFSEPENIQNVLALHQTVIRTLADKKPYAPTSGFDDYYYNDGSGMMSIDLHYTLKNGKTMQRSYSIVSDSAVRGLLKKLAESKENRLYLLGLVGHKSQKFSYSIRISDSSDKWLPNIKSDQRKAFLECLKTDVLNLKKQQGDPKQVSGTKYYLDITAISDDLSPLFNYDYVNRVTDKFAITADFPKTLAFLQNVANFKPAA